VNSLIICLSLSVEHAGSAAAHHHALLLRAVVGTALAAGTDHRLLPLLLRRRLLRTLLIPDYLCHLLLDCVDLLLHYLVLLPRLLPLRLLPCRLLLTLLGQRQPVVGLFLLQEGLVDASQHLRPEVEVGFLGGDASVLLGGVDEVQEDNLVEMLLFLLLYFILECLRCLPEAAGPLLLLQLPALLVLPVLLDCQFVPLDELAVRVLEEEVLIVDDVAVGGQALLELLVLAAEVEVLAVAAEGELFLPVTHQLHVVLKQVRELSEVVAALLLWKVELLVDEFLDEGVDVGLEEEGVAQGGLVGGDAVVEPPHAEAEERFPQAGLRHRCFVLLVEPHFLLEVAADVLADAHVKILPEVQVVLNHVEQTLSFRVAVVLHRKEVRELAAEVIGVVLVLSTAASERHVVVNAEPFALLAHLLAVSHEVPGFLLDELLQIGGVNARCQVELSVQMLPLRTLPTNLLEGLPHSPILVGQQSRTKRFREGVEESHLLSLLDAAQIQVLADGLRAVVEDLQEEV
jgi:hypothetical protein